MTKRGQIRVIRVDRKSPVLTRTSFGCLSNVHTLNVTRGCEFQCVYCYARGCSTAPQSGRVMLYANLLERLSKELNSPRRHYPVRHVAFNTASDSFQRHPDILKITYEAMRLILERGISLSFLTKGWIPDRFIELFSEYTDFISAGIGLVSISPEYHRAFEPGAATAQERLSNIERLESVGVKVQVRIDPIIPFYTDDEKGIHALFEELAERGVERVVLSYLHLRPAIFDQLKRELPSTAFKLLEGCFETQRTVEVGTSTRTRLCPLSLRKKGYDRFKEIGKEYGITCLVCACKNPDMPAQLCVSQRKDITMIPKKSQQLSLFPC